MHTAVWQVQLHWYIIHTAVWQLQLHWYNCTPCCLTGTAALIHYTHCCLTGPVALIHCTPCCLTGTAALIHLTHCCLTGTAALIHSTHCCFDRYSCTLRQANCHRCFHTRPLFSLCLCFCLTSPLSHAFFIPLTHVTSSWFTNNCKLRQHHLCIAMYTSYFIPCCVQSISIDFAVLVCLLL